MTVYYPGIDFTLNKIVFIFHQFLRQFILPNLTEIDHKSTFWFHQNFVVIIKSLFFWLMLNYNIHILASFKLK